MTISKKSAAIVRSVNFIFACLGICIIGGGSYVYYVDSGPLSQSFIQGPCIFIGLFGVCVLLLSFLGHQGLHYRAKRKGWFTGFNIFCFYIFILVLLAVGELWGLVYTSDLLTELKNAAHVTDTDYPTLSTDEQYLSQLFNGFYFANSIGQCDSVTGLLFWSFISNYCPEKMQSSHCRKCYPYGVGDCVVDQNSCNAHPLSVGPQCPYILCKQGVLTYAIDKFELFEYGLIGMALFQMILVCIVISVIIHYNAKKGRWSIIKFVDRRKVAPEVVDEENAPLAAARLINTR